MQELHMCHLAAHGPEGLQLGPKLNAAEAGLLREGQAGELTIRGKEFVSFR